MYDIPLPELPADVWRKKKEEKDPTYNVPTEGLNACRAFQLYL